VGCAIPAMSASSVAVRTGRKRSVSKSDAALSERSSPSCSPMSESSTPRAPSLLASNICIAYAYIDRSQGRWLAVLVLAKCGSVPRGPAHQHTRVLARAGRHKAELPTPNHEPRTSLRAESRRMNSVSPTQDPYLVVTLKDLIRLYAAS